ncbi:hypothetical protein MJO10_31090, partial [Salmonella enterica subsp. enterica serovar Anatum]|nr:hypothetical protein [Salmonella enterica subsp. enterica serovar Anatum]
NHLTGETQTLHAPVVVNAAGIWGQRIAEYADLSIRMFPAKGSDGLISRNLMEIVGLNVGNYIVGQIFGDDEVRVNCAAANLNIA